LFPSVQDMIFLLQYSYHKCLPLLSSWFRLIKFVHLQHLNSSKDSIFGPIPRLAGHLHLMIFLNFFLNLLSHTVLHVVINDIIQFLIGKTIYSGNLKSLDLFRVNSKRNEVYGIVPENSLRIIVYNFCVFLFAEI